MAWFRHAKKSRAEDKSNPDPRSGAIPRRLLIKSSNFA
jgi:hypothetical protein